MKRVLTTIILLISIVYAEVPTKKSVARLYMATFDRAPEEAGLNYWINDSGLSLEGVASSFFDQPETKLKYPSFLTNKEFVEAVYRNLLDRKPDKKGLEYWLKELNSKNITKDHFILAIINSTLKDDKTLMDNLEDVALYFADSGISDIRKAELCMANIDNNYQSVIEAKSIIDDFLKTPTVVDSGSDRHENYFLYDINNTKFAYKADGCIFPLNKNTKFDYQIFSNNTIKVEFSEDGTEYKQYCAIEKKFQYTKATDGDIKAFYLGQDTLYDGNSQIYYQLYNSFDRRGVKIENGGSTMVLINRDGYYGKAPILSSLKRVALSHRGVKPLNKNESIIEYGYSRGKDRSIINDANGILYLYKSRGCIFPVDENSSYYYEISNDYTMRVVFYEDGRKVVSRCGLFGRYRKTKTKNSKPNANRIEGKIYYSVDNEIYYKTREVYRGTIINIYNGAENTDIQDIPGYIFHGSIEGVYKNAPLSHHGHIELANPNLSDKGYMRGDDITVMYDLRSTDYTYKLKDGCPLPNNSNIFTFNILKSGKLKIYYDGNTIEECIISKKYKFITPKDGISSAKIIDENYYYDNSLNQYYRSKKIEKGEFLEIFADGQIAYVKDAKNYYYWFPIYETLIEDSLKK